MDVSPPQEIPLPRLPLACPRVAVGLDDPSGGRHEQRPGEISRGLREDVGRVRHDHAVSGRSRDVDVVEPDGHVRHDLEVGAGGEDFLVDGADDVADQRFLALKPPDQLSLRQRDVCFVVVHGPFTRNQ